MNFNDVIFCQIDFLFLLYKSQTFRIMGSSKFLRNVAKSWFIHIEKGIEVNRNIFFFLIVVSMIVYFLLKKEVLIGNFPFLLKAGFEPKDT